MTLDKKAKNEIVIAIYLLSTIIWLNVLPPSIMTHSVGIAFLIATIYGFVTTAKGVKFLF